ncbi:hypothetical protein ABE354_23635 [Brevibacillus laterosporus]
MNQTYFNVIVTYNNDTKQYGLWAKNIEEAREKAYLKWMNADEREVVEV